MDDRPQCEHTLECETDECPERGRTAGTEAPASDPPRPTEMFDLFDAYEHFFRARFWGLLILGPIAIGATLFIGGKLGIAVFVASAALWAFGTIRTC